MSNSDALDELFTRLNGHFGDLGWWPAEGPFEVVVGAILTQNVAWRNVETAIGALKQRNLLSAEALAAIPEGDLARVIRPSGYHNQKASRIKAFVRFFIDLHGASIGAMQSEPLASLREQLLEIRGIGPETADSILLYACEKPIFVSDAYTARILSRHGLIATNAGYEEIQARVMASFSNDCDIFRQLHALFVATAKTYCKKRSPDCNRCPLAGLNGRPEIR